MKRQYRKYTKELLAPIVKESRSIAQVIQNLGLRPGGGTHRNLSNLIKKYRLSTKHFIAGWPKGRESVNRHTDESLLKTVFILNGSSTTGLRLRRWMLRLDLCKDGCAICGTKSMWNKRPLTLEVDHINGNHFDNRPKNLRLLCPNCHSQQSTNRRKN